MLYFYQLSQSFLIWLSEVTLTSTNALGRFLNLSSWMDDYRWIAGVPQPPASPPPVPASRGGGVVAGRRRRGR